MKRRQQREHNGGIPNVQENVAPSAGHAETPSDVRGSIDDQRKANAEKPRAYKGEAKTRRAHIVEVLLEDKKKTELPFSDVLKKFPHVSEQTLYNDAAFLQAEGKPISASKKRFIYDPEGLSTIRQRTLEQRREKELIARIAVRLAVPIHPDEPKIFTQQKKMHLEINLATRLNEYWDKAHRVIILDSGSTTLSIARHLADVKTPAPKRHLADLRVLTNGGMIFQAFNKLQCSHGLILVGGAVRRDTDAVAGHLAELCLEKMALQADIAYIGTTNLNEAGNFCCDHEDEASMKSRLLASARIRCIAADSTKLVLPGRGSAWSFTALDRSMIDIIITDPRIWIKDKDSQREERRQWFLKRAREENILIASEPVEEVETQGD